MEVGNVEDFVASVVQPALPGLGPAPRAMPVTARVPEGVLVVAPITLIAVAAQGLGAAVGDRAQHRDLGRGDGAARDKVSTLGARDGAEAERLVHRRLLAVGG